MSDLASLQIKIDTSEVEAATVAIDGLVDAIRRAEVAIERLNNLFGTAPRVAPLEPFEVHVVGSNEPPIILNTVDRRSQAERS